MQPKGANIKKSKNNGKPPNETFFFIVVHAEGKVERTWNAVRNNKEKMCSETAFVPVTSFKHILTIKCPNLIKPYPIEETKQTLNFTKNNAQGRRV